jgi:Ankyrin repeats (3 copies)
MADLGRVLDLAIDDKAPLSVIRAIVEADPGCLARRRRNNGGIVKANGEGGKTRGGDGDDDAGVDELEDEEGETEEEEDDADGEEAEPKIEGWQDPLCLHRAIRAKAPLDVISYLADKRKSAFAVKEKAGKENGYTCWLPMHLAADDAALEVVEVLINKCPTALMMKDHYGELPIHIAVAAGNWKAPDFPYYKYDVHKRRSYMTSFRSADVIKCLLDACPKSLLARSYGGSTPLHIAVRFASVEVVKLLVDECPQALRTEDACGQLPLHVAATERGFPKEIARCLVEACPDACSRRTRTESSRCTSLRERRGSALIIRPWGSSCCLGTRPLRHCS